MTWWKWLITFLITVLAGILFDTSDVGGFVAFFLTCTVFIACFMIFVIIEELQHEHRRSSFRKMTNKQLYDRASYLIKQKPTRKREQELEDINSIIRERDRHDNNSNI